jgi:uncharacterized protein (DUF488 family)
VPTVVFTIGYEGRQPDDLLDTLKRAGVDRLVDVRELPLSRRKGFSKTGLATMLESAGIAYDHVKPLGTPKQFRDLYKSRRQAEGEAGYREHLFGDAYPYLIELADSLEGTRSCLLCFEADHAECHRAVIVEALEERIPELEVKNL